MIDRINQFRSAARKPFTSRATVSGLFKLRSWIQLPPHVVEAFLRPKALLSKDPVVILSSMLALNSLRVISSLILTRLLSPADFGIVGMVTVAHYTINMLLDFGTDIYLIRHREIRDRRELDVIWTIRCLRLVCVAIVIALAAGIVARIFANGSLTVVLMVSALGFFASAPQSLSFSLAIREKKVLLMSTIDVVIAVLNLFLTVGMALWLRNYWALIISSIIGTSIRTGLSYVLFPGSSHRFAFDPKIAAEMWKFSRYIIGSSIVTLFLSQIDKFALGHFLTIGEFGTYMLAVNLASVPRAFCETYASRVFFPTFSKAFHEQPASLSEVFHAKLKHIGRLYCFSVGTLIATTPVVIAIMYQPRYADAAYYLALLSVPSFFLLSSLAATEALIAIGDVRATYQANLVRLGWLAPALSLAIWSGDSDAILLVLALSEIPATLYTWAKLSHRGVLSLRRELPTFSFGAAGALVGWFIVQIASHYFGNLPAGILGIHGL